MGIPLRGVMCACDGRVHQRSLSQQRFTRCVDWESCECPLHTGGECTPLQGMCTIGCLHMERTELAALFIDLEGFSHMSGCMDPESLVRYLLGVVGAVGLSLNVVGCCWLVLLGVIGC